MSIRSVASRLVCGRYCRSIAVGVLVCVLSAIAVEAASACTNTTVPSGNITYVYDVNGRLTGVVNASGRAATYVYDAVGNVTSIANPTAPVTLLGVSLNGQICATIYGTGFSSTPSQNTVTFKGAAATVDFSTPATIVITISALSCSPTCSVPVSVTSPARAATPLRSTSPKFQEHKAISVRIHWGIAKKQVSVLATSDSSR